MEKDDRLTTVQSPIEAWQSRGNHLEIDGRRVFYVDAGPRDGPVLLLLHGFPTSSFDFHRVLAALAARHRVVLHDHLGFGFSDKPASHSYSLLGQAEIALALWQELGIESGHLVAHDYGTSVATEVLARRERGGTPTDVLSATLTNGSVLLEHARLRSTQRWLRSPILGPILCRLINKAYFKHVMRGLWGEAGQVDGGDLEAMWHALRHADGHLRAPRISRYLDERQRFRHRWLGALDRFDQPLHLLWARRDPVATPAVARALHEQLPDAVLTWLEDAGHYPMLECPRRWSEAALDFVGLYDHHSDDRSSSAVL